MRTVLAAILALSSVPALAAVDEVITLGRLAERDPLQTPSLVYDRSGEEIADQHIGEFRDFVEQVPGLFILGDADPGVAVISIRGVSTNRTQDPSVAVLLDGVSLADPELFGFRMFDVSRVSVLKGPQGATYGRSASAGLIRIDTNRAGEDWNGSISAGFGNGDTYEFSAALGAVLIEDRLAFRIAGQTYDTDGFLTNTFLNEKVDHESDAAVRASFLFTPTDAISLDAGFTWQRDQGGAAYLSSLDVSNTFDGRLDGAALINPAGDFPGSAEREWLQVFWDLTAEFGDGFAVQLVGSYDDYDKSFIEELDFRSGPLTFFGAPSFPDGIQPVSQPVELTAFTQEISLRGSTGPVNWLVGGFFQTLDKQRLDDFGPLLFGAEAPLFDIESDRYAVFAEAIWAITDTLTLTGALRWDQEDRSQIVSGITSGTVTSARSDSFDGFQPKVSIDWQVSESWLLYALYAEGFKAGGFNPPPGPGAVFGVEFPNETTRSFEAGAKGDLLDGALRIGAAIYLTDYENYQFTTFIDGNSVVLSIPQVDIWGLEFEAVWQVTERFRIDAAFTLTESEIEAFNAPDPLGGGGTLSYAGNTVPFTPDWSAQIAGIYEQPIGAANLQIRLAWRHMGETFFEVDNVLHSPDHGALDAHISVSWKNYEVRLWGRNLTDERWANTAFGSGQTALLAFLGPDGPFDSFGINRGRQYGIAASAHF